MLKLFFLELASYLTNVNHSFKSVHEAYFSHVTWIGGMQIANCGFLDLCGASVKVLRHASWQTPANQQLILFSYYIFFTILVAEKIHCTYPFLCGLKSKHPEKQI